MCGDGSKHIIPYYTIFAAAILEFLRGTMFWPMAMFMSEAYSASFSMCHALEGTNLRDGHATIDTEVYSSIFH